jgi:hypothetical protein
MQNKKISEFPVTTSLAGDDIFLINHLGTTSTVAFSTLSAAVSNDSIKLPSGATGGQVLTYNGSTSTWVASAALKELPESATNGQVLTYNGSTSTWVASSLPCSKNTNGYTYLPNGIIMQWGTVTNSTAGIYTVNLPISFPSQFFTIVGTVANGPLGISSDADSSSVSKDGTSLSSFKVTIDGVTFATSWFAIGC